MLYAKALPKSNEPGQFFINYTGTQPTSEVIVITPASVDLDGLPVPEVETKTYVPDTSYTSFPDGIKFKVLGGVVVAM